MSGAPAEKITLDTSLDLRVFLFAAFIAVTAAVVIGLAAALQATGGDLNEHIKNGQHADISENGARELRKLQPRFLMASKVALALLRVAAAGLLVTSLVKLYRSRAGFDANGVVNIDFKMDKQPRSGEDLMRLYHQISDELAHQSG